MLHLGCHKHMMMPCLCMIVLEVKIYSLGSEFSLNRPKRNTAVAGGILRTALKGRKGEKEMGILNLVGVQSPEERECRRESGISGPHEHFHARSGIVASLTNENIIQ